MYCCLVLVVLSSCNKHTRVLKSSDYDYKVEKAKEYYNKGNYFRAIPLFEELIRIGKGARDVEDLYFFYAYSHYGQADYLLSSYYFSEFAKNYPRSMKAEEAQFMVAKSYHKLSPKASLEQTNTQKAIDYYQLFINSYKDSERVEEANGFIDELRAKMELKAFNAGQLYFNMKDYRAAATTFNNMLVRFPDTDRREEIGYFVTKSYYLLAQNSISSKQEERYEKSVASYLDMVDTYPQSSYLGELEKYYNESIKKLDKIKLYE